MMLQAVVACSKQGNTNKKIGLVWWSVLLGFVRLIPLISISSSLIVRYRYPPSIHSFGYRLSITLIILLLYYYVIYRCIIFISCSLFSDCFEFWPHYSIANFILHDRPPIVRNGVELWVRNGPGGAPNRTVRVGAGHANRSRSGNQPTGLHSTASSVLLFQTYVRTSTTLKRNHLELHTATTSDSTRLLLRAKFLSIIHRCLTFFNIDISLINLTSGKPGT